MNFLNKISSLEDALLQVKSWKKGNNKIVFTNGCFDIVHLGHVTYLNRAKDAGDKLIVGLNSDASVRGLKGEGRPVKDIYNRSAILAAFECVDMVIVFEADTPLNLIESINPDILIKGGDYTIANIVGADHVIKNGGEVKVLDFVKGQSSSNLISKMTPNTTNK